MNTPLKLLLALMCAFTAAFMMLSSTSCLLAGKSGTAGVQCTESKDCNDPDLGCVPIDELNPGGTRVCMPAPGDWLCKGKLYGDTLCDCGCGFQDIDCPGLSSALCAADGNNCPPGQQPVSDNNINCQ